MCDEYSIIKIISKEENAPVLPISCLKLIKHICNQNGLNKPDGRFLFNYHVTHRETIALHEALFNLRDRIIEGKATKEVAAVFVMWATIHIREKLNGRLTYQFLSDGLGFDLEKIGRQLITEGLSWWGRPIGHNNSGDRAFFLFSLMAEGGLPIGRLTQGASFAEALTKLVEDIEDRPGASTDIRDQCARKRLSIFPEVYVTNEAYVKVMRQLADELCALRADLPEGLAAQDTLQWLDRHKPGWTNRLPLQLNPNDPTVLIRDALKIPRQKNNQTSFVAWRELERIPDTQNWRACCLVGSHGVLAGDILPSIAQGKILHLEIEAPSWPSSIQLRAEPLDFSHASGGWNVARRDKRRRQLLALDVAATVSAWADGKPVGTGEILPALPDGMSFWGPRLGKNPETEEQKELLDHLEYIGERGQTSRSRIWLVAPVGTLPVVREGVSLLAGPEFLETEDGNSVHLWCFSGNGYIDIGTQHMRIQTSATDFVTEVQRLFPAGRRLAGWVCSSTGAPIWLGHPHIWLQQGNKSAIPIVCGSGEGKEIQFKCSSGRKNFNIIVAAQLQHEVIARITLHRLPSGFSIKAQETAPGVVECEVSGLHNGPDQKWSVAFADSKNNILLPFEKGIARGEIVTQGENPADLHLIIAEQHSGQSIELTRPWPSRHPFLVDDEKRLTQEQQIFISQLSEFRAIGPDDAELLLDVRGQSQSGTVPLCSPAPLSAQAAFLRQLMAQDTRAADGELALYLLAKGVTSPTLRVKRYARQCTEWSRLGIMDPMFLPSHETAEIIAVEVSGRLKNNTYHRETIPKEDNTFTLGARFSCNGEWMVYVTIDGEPYRPFFWSVPAMRAGSSIQTRKARIEGYIEQWKERLESGVLRDWYGRWRVIREAAEAGDAGALDEAQAIAHVPAAALCLLLLVEEERQINDVIALNEAVPLFWPCVSIKEFSLALVAAYRMRFEHERAQNTLDPDNQEDIVLAKKETVRLIGNRLCKIVERMPALRMHWMRGLCENGMLKDFEDFLKSGSLKLQSADLTDQFRIEKQVTNSGSNEFRSCSTLWNLAQDCARSVAQASRGDNSIRKIPRVSIPAHVPRANWQKLFPNGSIPGAEFGAEDLIQAPYIAARLALGDGLQLSWEERLSVQAALLFLSNFDSSYEDHLGEFELNAPVP